MVNPCYKCTERWVKDNGTNCHHECTRYKQYSDYKAQKCTMVYAEKQKQKLIVNYIFDRMA